MASPSLVTFVPELPEGFAYFLERFELTLPEYKLLRRCERNDFDKFACGLTGFSYDQRASMRSLKEKGFIRFSPETGKLELDSFGRYCLEVLPLSHVIQRPQKGGVVVMFPKASKASA